QTAFVTFLIGPLFIVLLPLAPIFLMVGSSRLLTRSTSRVYEAASRVTKPFTKNLYHVITRNLQRNPRRAANVAVIIGLGLAFGMFTLVTFSSQLAYQESQIRAEIGGGLSVDAPPSDPGFAASVRALPEVGGLTLVQRLYVPPNLGYADVFVLDPETYLSTTNPEPWYFRDFDREAVQRVLTSPDCDRANNRTDASVCQVLVTEGYLDSQSLAVGDVLTFIRDVRNETGQLQHITVTAGIGGTVRGLPGTSAVGPGVPLAIYGSRGTLGELVGTGGSRVIDPERYLVQLRAGEDWRAARDKIRSLRSEEHTSELQSRGHRPFPYTTLFRSTAGIGGTVRGLPGTSAVGPGVPLAIYGSRGTLGELVGTGGSRVIDPERYLVQLRAGEDWRAARDKIRSL